MIFKNIAMETELFGVESFNDLKAILEDECQSNDAPMLDVLNQIKKNKDDDNINNINIINDNNNINNDNNNNIINENKEGLIEEEHSLSSGNLISNDDNIN